MKDAKFFSDKYAKTVKKQKLDPDNANGIDKVDLYCLSRTMKDIGNVPIPPVNREIYDYQVFTNMEKDMRKILFFFMKVKLNVKIFENDTLFRDYVNKTMFDIKKVHYPAMVQDAYFDDCSIKELRKQLNWMGERYHLPQGPALSWIMVFPPTHFYCIKFKDDEKKYIPLPYEWLGLNENSTTENDKTESFITQVINETIVPFYAYVYFTNASYFDYQLQYNYC